MTLSDALQHSKYVKRAFWPEGTLISFIEASNGWPLIDRVDLAATDWLPVITKQQFTDKILNKTTLVPYHFVLNKKLTVMEYIKLLITGNTVITEYVVQGGKITTKWAFKKHQFLCHHVYTFKDPKNIYKSLRKKFAYGTGTLSKDQYLSLCRSVRSAWTKEKAIKATQNKF